MELLIYRLIRVPVISVTYFADKICSLQFCMVYQKIQMYIYCIHLFLYYWQHFVKPLAKAFRKTSNVTILSIHRNSTKWRHFIFFPECFAKFVQVILGVHVWCINLLMYLYINSWEISFIKLKIMHLQFQAAVF